MTYAIDVDQVVDYVLEDDRGLEDGDKAKPVFQIRTLTAGQVADIDDHVLKTTTRKAVDTGKGKKKIKKRSKDQDGGIIEMHVGTVVLKILDHGLVGFHNMHKPNGQPVEWDDDERQRMYSLIPTEGRTELANEIRNRSDLNEEDIANLD